MSSIGAFPEDVAFKYPWRPHQERVLSALQSHLADKRLHVVAAPGSGKTALGLEVIRRLNRPALVLAPTISIRDQWINRFVRLFLPEGSGRPEWVSASIRSPGLLTVVTYQALHAACSGLPDAEQEGESDENGSDEPSGELDAAQRDVMPTTAVDLLRDHGIGTIVVDEAHHLRTEWWQTLREMRESFPDALLVALTATPPYDVSPLEWERYQQLCGTVDAEVLVPELVLAGSLCPHQDYIRFSTPSLEELALIRGFRESIAELMDGLCGNAEFVAAVAEHPWLASPDAHIEAILEQPEYYSSMLIFLNQVRARAPEQAVEILGVPAARLPTLTPEWLEVLLTGCLLRDREVFRGCEPLLQSIERSLTRMGALERRRISLRTNRQIESRLTSSVTKLDGIVHVVKLEGKALAYDLRMLILTDFIRASDLPRSAEDVRPVQRIGVASIFEKIRRARVDSIRLGVLSGSLVIIPYDARTRFIEAGAEMGVPAERITYTPLPHDSRYVRVEVTGADRDRIVQLITGLFASGGLTVLVGTKALLGEGWDAPSINCLVLASFVGSYMLSNQMRGRAIRTQQGKPEKTANIWHLACVEPGVAQPSEDYETLARRFRAFLGVAFDMPVIESGLARLNVEPPPFTQSDIEHVNREMAEHARDRAGLLTQWQEALVVGAAMGRVEELRASSSCVPSGFIFTDVIAALFWESIFSGGFIGSMLVRDSLLIRSSSLRNTLIYVGAACLIGALVALPGLIRALWLLLRHGPVAGSLRQIGKALVHSLRAAGVIATPEGALRVVVRQHGEEVFCALSGGTAYETSAYVEALQELLDPIENPRYLLARKSRLSILSRLDYHAVPAALGRKKELAESLVRMWRRSVGPADLIYTRTTDGRKVLLRARSRSLSSVARGKTEHISCWR